MSDAAANGASEELKQALFTRLPFRSQGLVAVVTGGGTGLQADVTEKSDLEKIIKEYFGKGT
ncbi:hypothetical protein PGT21_033217 [Puccinia graminis f. sp. tritici]|uniref:Uncharacterized protein n=1 Tax=Puccinia graminis f. sp. tritici TaxID=56615 RepID=A0A5B0M837_PUCGR|nr:hypothetical protein PGT21_033217 [Puccinia graminis f. sp. tritici]